MSLVTTGMAAAIWSTVYCRDGEGGRVFARLQQERGGGGGGEAVSGFAKETLCLRTWKG